MRDHVGMTAEEATRQFVNGDLTAQQWNSRLAEIGGPESNAGLALYTQFENSDWTEDELRRRAKELLPD